jgi:hypothetical protein
MPKLNRSVVYTQRMSRLFFQMGGAAPDNPVTFYGQNNQYAALEGVKESYGSVDPIYMRDPSNTDSWTILGRKRAVPDLSTASLTMMQNIGYVPRNLGTGGCEFNVYLPVGNCKALDDPVNGWDYIEVYAGCIAEDRDGDDPFPVDKDDARIDKYSLKISETYRVGQLAFGEAAAPQIDREIVDVVFGGGLTCGNCGPSDDGTTRIYAVVKSSGAGSPGVPAELVYVNRNPDTGATTTYEYPLTGFLSASQDPVSLAIIGNYIVVLSNAYGGYGYAAIDPLTGTVGSFTGITSGFVASKSPNDIYVASNFQAYIVGDGGYIYSLGDVTAGVTTIDAGSATTANLARIHGEGRTLVAVGASGAVVVSSNGGDSWGTASGSLGAGSLTAVAVLSDTFWYVGGTQRYYTRNGGVSWTQQTIAGAVSIQDIVFVTPEVGYTLYSTGSAAKIQVTTFGGARWADVGAGTITSRVRGWPSFQVANRIAVPNAPSNTAVGTVAIGGRSGAALTDGKLLIGVTATL